MSRVSRLAIAFYAIFVPGERFVMATRNHGATVSATKAICLSRALVVPTRPCYHVHVVTPKVRQGMGEGPWHRPGKGIDRMRFPPHHYRIAGGNFAYNHFRVRP
jgi:hypothetical protein